MKEAEVVFVTVVEFLIAVDNGDVEELSVVRLPVAVDISEPESEVTVF